MRAFNFYHFVISVIILLISVYFAFTLHILPESLRHLQIFGFAVLCGFSIHEVWHE